MAFSGAINVVNRKGETVPMHLETISKRLFDLANMEPRLAISTDRVAIKTAASLIDGINTSEIDVISAGICASLIIDDYDYDALAARIMISNLHKTTHGDLRPYVKELESYAYRNLRIKILHPKLIAFVLEYSNELNDLIDYSKDYTYNYFGAITLINAYLLAYKYDDDRKVVKERPQQLLLRVSIGIHLDEINDDGTCGENTFQSIVETYKMLSSKYYTHATPTLFNAGTINHTLSSCYLLSVNDSLKNIYGRMTDISEISKFSGGVGIHVSQIRAQGSVIASTVGRSEGLLPMMRMYNESTKYVSQGGGKRKGSTAVYIEPWHADIEAVLLSQKQQGIPERLCRDLFAALWVPDVFMERLKRSIKTAKPVMWSLMCPDECKGLPDSHSEEFKHIYESYEQRGMYRKRVPVVQLWNLLVSTQIETGKPYLMYKDSVNRKCNQNNLGVIKSSNLCVHGDTRILTYQGYQAIRSLENQLVLVWNGQQWSTARVRKTGEDRTLIKVTTNDGAELLCTPYHKFKLDYGKLVEAQNLKVGSVLMQCSSWPTIDGNQTTHGETKVPINGSLQTKRQWLATYLDSHTTVSRWFPNQMTIDCESHEVAYDIKLLCNTMGFSPSIALDESEGAHQIQFTSRDVYHMFEVMRLPASKPRMLIEPSSSFCRTVEVVSIEMVEGAHDTYCFNEPLQHMGVFNGMLTSQCAEITIYSDDDQVGVCNLASICLPKFVSKHTDGSVTFDYHKLNKVTQRVVINMNRVMDNNKYPIDQAKYSDDQHRPIGVGVQGLADVFMMMGEPFDSEHSRKVNSQIFETIYFAALTASNKLAQRDGTYKSFRSSMTARGIFQFDLWNNQTLSLELGWDWPELRHKVQMSGLRNSLLVALMPTASTAIIQENCESIEPIQSNVFKRSTLNGQFQVVNKHLMRDLKKMGLWSQAMRDRLIQEEGSVQNIAEIPQRLRDIYKTVFEYKLSNLVQMCADRERFVCQSASNNRYVVDPTISKITKLHLLAWKLGLKTSSYYLRCKQQVTGKKLISTQAPLAEEECMSCSA